MVFHHLYVNYYFIYFVLLCGGEGEFFQVGESGPMHYHLCSLFYAQCLEPCMGHSSTLYLNKHNVKILSIYDDTNSFTATIPIMNDIQKDNTLR